MNVSTNLPEPTYRFKQLFVSLKNTKRLIKNMVFLAKKIMML